MGSIGFFQGQMPRGMVPCIQPPPPKGPYQTGNWQHIKSQLHGCLFCHPCCQCLGGCMRRIVDKCKIQYRQQALLYPCWRSSDRHPPLEVQFLPLHPGLLQAWWRGLSFQRKCYRDWDLHTNCLPGLIHYFHPSGWLDELFQAFLNAPKVIQEKSTRFDFYNAQLPHSTSPFPAVLMFALMLQRMSVFLLKGI